MLSPTALSTAQTGALREPADRKRITENSQPITTTLFRFAPGSISTIFSFLHDDLPGTRPSGAR